MKCFKCISLFITLLSVTLLNAQDAGRTYHDYINTAELSITEDDYKTALMQYNEAFVTTGVSFTADLYNAAVCAVKLNKRDEVLKFADKLAEKGVGEHFFNKNIFKEYRSDKAFKKITAKAEEVEQRYEKNNKAYSEKLKEFVTLDDGYNKLRLKKYSEYYEVPDTLETLFRTNTQNLFDYIKKNGFYTEEKIGASVVSDTIVRVAHDADVVFLHYLEMGKDRNLLQDIKNLYVSNLNGGKIPPSHISSIVRMTEHIFGDVGEYAYKIYQCKLYKMNKLPEPEKVAKYRQEYLFDSIDDYGRKLAFVYERNKDFIFNYHLIVGGYIDEEFLYSSYSVIAKIADCKE